MWKSAILGAVLGAILGAVFGIVAFVDSLFSLGGVTVFLYPLGGAVIGALLAVFMVASAHRPE